MTRAKSTTPPTLATKHKIKFNGGTKEIFMTYGLLAQLSTVIGTMEEVNDLFLLPEARDAAVSILLSERDEEGEITKSVHAFNLEADPKDINDLLKWAGAHLFDFLLTAAENGAATLTTETKRLQALMSSSNGLKASLPTKPSA